MHVFSFCSIIVKTFKKTKNFSSSRRHHEVCCSRYSATAAPPPPRLRDLVLSGERAVVVALAEAGPAGGGEAALEAFAEGSTYYAALTLETDNCVASPTQMSAHSDLASSHRSVQAPGPAGGGGRGVAGIASQLLGVWEAAPGQVAVALEVAVPPLSVRGQSAARLEVRQYVAVEDCLYSGLEIGMPASRRGGGAGGGDALRSPGRRPPLASPKSPWPSLGLSQSITQQVLHQGAARVATLARRWLRRVQVAAPLAVTSRTQPCGPERLLHINLSNELAVELSVSSIHLQCVPGGGSEARGEHGGGGGGSGSGSVDSVVMSYLGERPSEEAPVRIPPGVQHSFVIRPVVLDARGLPSQDALDVVSCFVTCVTADCQSCVVYQHAVDWEEPPRAPLKVALTVGGQRALESGHRVLDLRVSTVNLSGEDKTLRLMTARSLGGGQGAKLPQPEVPATPGAAARTWGGEGGPGAPGSEEAGGVSGSPAASSEEPASGDAAPFFLQSCIPLGRLRDRESREVQCELVVTDPGVVRIEDFWIKDDGGRTYSLGSELCVLCE